ncbi:MAG: MFS family permease, partial [Myxococcota bacterium]
MVIGSQGAPPISTVSGFDDNQFGGAVDIGPRCRYPASMLTAAQILQNLGFLLYGGPLVAFTILIATADALPHMKRWDLVRSYRAWGPGLGISLGASIFGMLVAYWLEHGSFSWGWSTPDEVQILAAWLTFFVLWVSNLKLEVWTLEPLRKLDSDGIVQDEAAYTAATGRLLRHMWFQTVIILVVCA